MLLFSFLIVIFLISLIIILYLNRKPSGLPPGEWGWPIIGTVPPRNVRFWDYLAQLAKKHGDIYSLKIGQRIIVVMADFQDVKSAYSMAEFSSRPSFYSAIMYLYFKNIGIFNAVGHGWKTNRNTTMKHLREFGMGKSFLEDTISLESKYLIENLSKKLNEPTLIEMTLNVASLNIMWKMVGDKRFEIDDPKIQRLTSYVRTTFQISEGPVKFLDVFPWAIPFVPSFLLKKWMRISELKETRGQLHHFLRDAIMEHRATLDADNPRDLIDAYLIDIESQKDDEGYDYEESILNLTSIIHDMVAGSDTTASTLKWFFLYMATHQDIQEKLHKEIDAVVPKDRLPSLNDKDRLPYVDAALHDLNRIISLTPIAIPHATTQDMTFKGYTIPKDTVIIPLLEVMHKSGKYYERPNEYYPEHFLDKNGKFNAKKEGYLPFCIGRRICLGESIASMQLFLLLSAILQKFHISPPPGQKIDLTEDPQAFILMNIARSHKVVLSERV